MKFFTSYLRHSLVSSKIFLYLIDLGRLKCSNTGRLLKSQFLITIKMKRSYRIFRTISLFSYDCIYTFSKMLYEWINVIVSCLFGECCSIFTYQSLNECLMGNLLNLIISVCYRNVSYITVVSH